MADVVDDAQEMTEMNLRISLQNARQQVRQHPFTGLCRNCHEHIDQGTFCPGGECRDDYAKRAIFNK
jgi:hypothetical protein